MLTKFKTVLIEQLTMGATPEKLAQSVLCGALVGICPILGTATPIAAGIAVLGKLNHVVVQSVNYLFYPVQILMVPVYIKTVSLVFDVGDIAIRPDLILEQFKASPMLFLKQYSLIGLYAVVVWILIAVIAYVVCYPILVKSITAIKVKVFKRQTNI